MEHLKNEFDIFALNAQYGILQIYPYYCGIYQLLMKGKNWGTIGIQFY